MSDELEDIVDNLREPSAWLRVVFMLAFALVLYLVIAPVVLVLMVAQALFSVISGEDNENLRGFGAALSLYIAQILQYLTYNSDTRPFPFSDFPVTEEAAEKPKAKKSKKTPSKKTAAKKPSTKPAVRKKPASKPKPDKEANKETNKEGKPENSSGGGDNAA